MQMITLGWAMASNFRESRMGGHRARKFDRMLILNPVVVGVSAHS